MPRTKAVRRYTKASILSKPERDKLLKDFDDRVEAEKQLIIGFHERQLKKIDEEYQMLLEMYKPDLNKTIGQLRAEALKENTAPTAESSHGSPTTSSVVTKDDGYVTDGSSVQLKMKRPQRQSRSLSRNNAKSGIPSENRYRPKRSLSSGSGSTMGPPRSCRSRYRTPMNKIIAGTPQYPPITPKVTPNTPITVLRRPRQGEMVVSLSGSPLLVNSANVGGDKANCNIPLADGTVLSLLPSRLKEASSVNLPFDQMRPEIKSDIKMLHANLTAYLKKFRI